SARAAVPAEARVVHVDVGRLVDEAVAVVVGAVAHLEPLVARRATHDLHLLRVAHEGAVAAALRLAGAAEAREVVDGAVAVIVEPVAQLARWALPSDAREHAARAAHRARGADADAALPRRAAGGARALHVVNDAVAVVVEAVAD